MQSLTLSSGHSVPLVGLGTWKSKPGEVRAAVEAAIDIGYRHIDCAAIYGNEAEIGQGLKAKLDAGVVQRGDLFITSKLWNNAHKAADVRPACEKTLADLGLEYLDLYLIHWPHAFQPGGDMIPKREDGTVLYDEETDSTETWAAMEQLVEAGLVRSIGISNFNARQVRAVLDMCKIKPVTNQVERHPYFDQRKLLEMCTAEGIPLTAYCPLGSGDNPFRKPDDPWLLDEPVLKQIGEQHGKSAAQIALRWQIQQGVIVVPKSVSAERLAQNFEVCNFELSEENLAAIAALNRDWRMNEPTITADGVVKKRDAGHKHYPFNDEF